MRADFNNASEPMITKNNTAITNKTKDNSIKEKAEEAEVLLELLDKLFAKL